MLSPSPVLCLLVSLCSSGSKPFVSRHRISSFPKAHPSPEMAGYMGTTQKGTRDPGRRNLARKLLYERKARRRAFFHGGKTGRGAEVMPEDSTTCWTIFSLIFTPGFLGWRFPSDRSIFTVLMRCLLVGFGVRVDHRRSTMWLEFWNLGLFVSWLFHAGTNTRNK